MFNFIKSLLTQQKLSYEQKVAFFHRLPKSVKVGWKKEGGLIVGWVNTGDKQFVTQGRDAFEFIRMVNESVYTVYDIPYAYMEDIKNLRAYNPPEEEEKKLFDGNILFSSFALEKNKNLLQTAGIRK